MSALIAPKGWHVYTGTPSNQVHAKDCPTCKAIFGKERKS